MIPVVTGEEMRRIDRRAIEVLGIPGTTLMENAGRGAAEVIADRFSPVAGKKILVVCGKGNNGGDGFVCARHLAAAGARPLVLLLAEVSELKGDAAHHFARLATAKIPVTQVTEASTLLARIRELGPASDLVVDALLGTGVSGPAQGLISEAMTLINAFQKPVISLDLPSGLSSDRGGLLGPTVRATLTVTFALPKRGLLLYPGAREAGEVVRVEIGIPEAEMAREVSTFLLEAKDIRAILPARRADQHKGDFGHLLVLAGSLGKTGAAVLTSLAALRAGAGLVTLATAESQQPIVAAMAMEVMTEPLPETPARSLSLRALDRILALVEPRDAVVLGPGLSLDPETQRLIRELVTTLDRPMVVDADGLTALAGHLDLLEKARAPLLLTPHPGEMARLLGCSVREVEEDRITIVQRFCRERRVHLALKGARTVIGSPDGRVFLNPTGNVGMATGGSGDVLTGVVGGLLVQGIGPLETLQAGVYLHGLAGDLARDLRGEAGLIAGDLLEQVPQAMRRVTRGDTQPRG